MNALVIAPHPDDETLGCGGTLLRMKSAGYSIHWLLVTAAWEPEFSRNAIDTQIKQVNAVKEAYAFDSSYWLKFPTTQLDAMPINKIISPIRSIVTQLRPAIIFIPNGSDIHSDHRIVFQSLTSVVKTFYMSTLNIAKVLVYETLSETEAAVPCTQDAFTPNVYIDISSFLSRKIEILKLYETEIQTERLPRTPSAVQALARFRGATIGVEYAEAFMLLREIMTIG